MGEQTPPLEVTSEEYFKELKHYYGKVHSHQPLDITEIKGIITIKKRLEGMYQPDVLNDSQIMMYIHHILGKNGTVSRAREEERLKEELVELGIKLRNEPLTSDQKETIEARRDDICGILYPEYHPPTS